MARLTDFLADIDLSELEDYILSHGKPVSYSRGESLVQPGEVCPYFGLVKSGYFKYSALNSKAQEVVGAFVFEGDIVTDFAYSFLFGEPTTVAITAGCDSEIIRMPIAAVRRHLSETHPQFIAKVSAHLLKEAYRRYLTLLVKTPAERYHDLLSRHTDIVNQIPLQEIASFLGVSRRQLHRIRESESLS